MLPFYSMMFVLLLACALFFYRAGRFEGSSGVAWAGASVLGAVAIWRWLDAGLLAFLVGQLGLLAVVTLYRIYRKQ